MPSSDEKEKQESQAEGEGWEEGSADILLDAMEELLKDERKRYQDITHKAYYQLVAASILLAFAGSFMRTGFPLFLQLIFSLSCGLLLLSILFFIYPLWLKDYPSIAAEPLIAAGESGESPQEIKRRLLRTYADVIKGYKETLGGVVPKIELASKVLFGAACVELVGLLVWLLSNLVSSPCLWTIQKAGSIYITGN